MKFLSMKQPFLTVLLSLVAIESQAENIDFPRDSGVVDVTKPPYLAKADGVADDTVAIQKALDDHPSANAIIYLPKGTYLVSDTLRWPDGPRRGLEQKRTILQGQSGDGTVVKLKDSAAGFGDAEKRKAVIWTGRKPAQRFRNAIRNLTVNTGKGNDGAVGIQFIANNQGVMADVRIVSGDGGGAIGLDMSYTDEIGPMLVRGLTVEGFDLGIKTYWQTASITFEDVTLKNQNRLGWENYGQTIFVRNLKSTNVVTVLKNVKNGPSRVLLVGAQLDGVGDAVKLPAILNEKTMYARDIRVTGYARAITHSDKGRGNKEGVPTAEVDEWLSHEEPVSLFPSPPRTLRLPIKETPRVPWDELPRWSSPLAFGGRPNDKEDDTAAIQKAIDSGATTVYLPNGTWLLDGKVRLRGNVRRFLGTEARLNGKGALWLVEGEHPVVVVQRLDVDDVRLIHDARRTLVLSQLLGGNYSNTSKGNGDLFLEDVVMGTFVFRKQNVWARQLNQETDTQKSGDEAKVVNDGGRLWILGMKTEQAGTIIKTISGGQTELLGAFIFNNAGQTTEPAFINDESSVSLAGAWETRFGNTPIQTWVRETRNGQTRTIETLGRSPLYVGYANQKE